MLDEEDKKTMKEVMWPYNLCEVFLGGYAAGDEDYGPNGPVDFTPKAILKRANDVLSARELAVIEMRYRDGMTLKEAGAKIGVQSERCRQIEAKALRKLQGPRVLQYASVPWKCWKAERDARLRAEEQLKFVLEHITYTAHPGIEPVTNPDEVSRLAWVEMPIDDMDLSVRSFNCLKRAGLNTVGDLIRRFEFEEDFMKIRNLGRKSAEEVIQKVHKMGLRFRWENE